MNITLPRATVEQALEAMRRAVPTGKITLYEWDKAMAALRAALAEDALDRLAENERALGIQMEAPRATLAQQQTKRACCTYPDCRCPIDKSTVCAKGLPEQAEPVEPNRWEGDHDIESPNNGCMHKGYCMSLKQAREPMAQQVEPVCKCDLRTRLVGDGCEVCNPELAAELAQQAEPVAVFDERMGQPVLVPGAPMLKDEQPLYTAPPKLVPLTDEEIVRIRMSMPHSVPSPDQHPYDWAVRYARAVERALEEKNRGR